MKRRLSFIAALIWLLLATSTLVATLGLYDGTAQTRDAELVLFYGMFALSFPASLVILMSVGALGYSATLFGISMAIPMNSLVLTIEWATFLVSGYLQWFVLLPWCVRKWKTRQTKKHSARGSV
jgi:hypothetical protein